MGLRRAVAVLPVHVTGVAAAVAAVGVVAACTDGSSGHAVTSTGLPITTATTQSDPGAAGAESYPAAVQPVAPDPRIGALFLGGGPTHTCSGTVLDSRTQDLILTAAHCLVDGVDTTFVPGFNPDTDVDDADDADDGPSHPWHVTAVYLDPRWLHDQDEQADFAIARVSRAGGTTIEQRVGGGLALASAPAAGTAVAVTGYPVGDGGPLICHGVTAMAAEGFPSLECAGVADGFSGAPWVVGSTVTGLVGGLDGGGCDDDVSFSPRFDEGVVRLLERAQDGDDAGDDGDAAPAAAGPNC
jgi:hypothetical protein